MTYLVIKEIWIKALIEKYLHEGVEYSYPPVCQKTNSIEAYSLTTKATSWYGVLYDRITPITAHFTMKLYTYCPMYNENTREYFQMETAT